MIVQLVYHEYKEKKSLIITILSFTNDHDNYGNECYLARELSSSSSSTPFFLTPSTQKRFQYMQAECIIKQEND